MTPPPDLLLVLDHQHDGDALPEATGGQGGYTYAITPALPAGLTHEGSSTGMPGRIAGTPTTLQTATLYSWMVTDSGGGTVSADFRITVANAAIVGASTDGRNDFGRQLIENEDLLEFEEGKVRVLGLDSSSLIARDVTGTFGLFVLRTDGEWLYELLPNDATLMLDDGHTGRDVFTIRAADDPDVTAEIVFEIAGRNTPPVPFGNSFGLFFARTFVGGSPVEIPLADIQHSGFEDPESGHRTGVAGTSLTYVGVHSQRPDVLAAQLDDGILTLTANATEETVVVRVFVTVEDRAGLRATGGGFVTVTRQPPGDCVPSSTKICLLGEPPNLDQLKVGEFVNMPFPQASGGDTLLYYVYRQTDRQGMNPRDDPQLPPGLNFSNRHHQRPFLWGTPTEPLGPTVFVFEVVDDFEPEIIDPVRSTFTISVLAEETNRPPVAPAVDDRQIAVGRELMLLISSGSDPDGDPLTYQVLRQGSTGLPGWLEFDGSTRTLSGTPGPGDIGVVPLTLFIFDTSNAGDSADFTITVVPAPVVIPSGTYAVAENARLDTAVGAALTTDHFPDGEGAWSIMAGNEGNAFTIDADGQLRTAGDLDHETVPAYTLSVAFAQGGETAEAPVAVAVTNVNEAPEPPPVADREAVAGSAFSYRFDAARDPDGDALTYSAGLADGNALPAWLDFDGAARAFSGTPEAGDTGQVRVRVTVTDSGEPPLDNAAEFTITVRERVAVTINPGIAGDDIINIAEKAAGFDITGTTDAGASVSVTVGGGTPRPADVTGTTWTVAIPGDAAEIAGTSVTVTATAMLAGRADNAARRTVTADLVPPTATYAAPASMMVDVAVPAIAPGSPSGDTTSYAADALPGGLALDPITGVISGTPTTADEDPATVDIGLTDSSGNPGTAEIAFPPVAPGPQTLSGFAYVPADVRRDQAPPQLTVPTVAPPPGGALSYSAAPGDVCTVNATSGAMTLRGVGACVATATAAATANRNAASATFTVTVAGAPLLAGTTTILVPENTPSGAPIGSPLTPVNFPPATVEAPTTWTVTGDGPFAVDAGTGQLSLNGPLDFETMPNRYDLMLRLDQGGADAAAPVTVIVLDVDNSAVPITIDANIAGNDIINIAEKASGFEITGTTEANAQVVVSLGSGAAQDADVVADTATGARWTVTIPPGAPEIAGTGLTVSATATIAASARMPGTASRILTVDIDAPTAGYTPPGSLMVGVPIAAIAPDSPSGDVTGYSLQTGTLPPGLTLDGTTGVIAGTPTTADAAAAPVVIGLTDSNGNTGMAAVTFPPVDKGVQTLSGLAYVPAGVRLDETPPVLTPPTVAPPPGGALSYSAEPASVCTVEPESGAMTLAGAGACTVTATAAGTANRNAASAAFTVTIAPRPTLAGATTITVPEITPAGSDIGQPLVPQDFPPGAGAWTVDTAGAPFAVNAGTGQLSVTQDLDFETPPNSYDIVVALSRGGATAMKTVTVIVIDVDESEVDVGIDANIAGDDIVNIAEKAAGFAITGTTEDSAEVRVTVGTALPRSADVTGTIWSLAIPPNAPEIAGTGVTVTATATLPGGRADGTAGRTLAADLEPPVAAWAAPATLTVGMPIAAIAPGNPSGDVTGYGVQAGALPPGLDLDGASGVISGTPTAANADAAPVTIRLTDSNGNTGDVVVALPPVDRGTRILTGLAYTPATVREDQPPPALTPPTAVPAAGAVLAYSAAPASVCAVVEATGALTLAGPGTCTVTATAAETEDYNEAVATATVAVTPAPSLTGTTTILVPENTPPGSSIGTPLTPVNFPPGIAAWSIVGDAGPVAINGGTGQLTLAGALDFETGPKSYAVTVQLVRGDAEAEAGVTVIVTDVNETEVAVTIAANIAGNDIINIAERAAGFAVTGTTENGATVMVALGSGSPREAAVNGTGWTLAVPGNAAEVAGSSLTVTAVATRPGTQRAAGAATRTVILDLQPPAASWSLPAALTVGVPVAAVAPTGASPDTAGYAVLSGALPPGLALDGATGTVSGTPTTADGEAAPVTIRLTDSNGNTGDVPVAFPPVDRGRQILSGFAYVPERVRLDEPPPVLIPPTVTPAPGGTLSYSAAPDAVCEVDPVTGAMTLEGAGTCVVTATAAQTANYNAASVTASATITVVPSPSLAGTTTFTVAEIASVGSTVGQPLTPLNFPPGVPTWSIGTAGVPFAINGSTGQLSLTAALDFETEPNSYSFAVRLMRGGADATADITVIVTDIDESAVAVAIAAGIAGNDTVNIAEKAAGFAITGTTEADAEVSVTLGPGRARAATVTGTGWSVAIPADDPEIAGTSLTVSAVASLGGGRTPGTAARTLTVDLVAPTATWTPPATLTVGVPVAAILPEGASGDVTGYALEAGPLPPGLTLDPGTGAIAGTPTTADSAQAAVSVRLTDANGNTGTVPVTLPAVARGAQALTGFAYDPDSVRLDQQPPTLIPPTGARPDSALSYASSSAGVCMVDGASGALTLIGAGTCAVTVTAAATDDYNAATDTTTVTVTPRPTLAGTTVFLVPETTPVGSGVGTPLTPVNFPPGAAAWSITSGAAAPFAIDGGTGQLSLTGALDFGVGPTSHALTISLARGGAEASANVTVMVTEVDQSEVAVTIGANIAGDDVINIAERAAGFTIAGTTEAGAQVRVILGAGTPRPATVTGTSWALAVPEYDPDITGTGVAVTATAEIPASSRAVGTARRTLTADLVAPSAAWTVPATLRVGVPIAAIPPSGPSPDVTGYGAASGELPPGLALDPATGVISGTPGAASTEPDPAIVILTDMNGNTGEVALAFPPVDRGTQILTGFGYDPDSVRLDQPPPVLIPPSGARPDSVLSYSAAPAGVCTVVSGTGALTHAGEGICTITATAAATDDYSAAVAIATVAVTPRPSLTGLTTFGVAENTAVHTAVGTPLVPMNFPPGNAAWSITSGADGPFAIDGSTGQLSVTRMLDFETLPNVHQLTVQLQRGDGTATAQVTVTETDVNETAVDVTIAANIAGDDVVNIAEKEAGFVISGTTEAGAAVGVRLGPSDSPRSATVSGTAWSVAVPAAEAALTGGSIAVTATATLSGTARIPGTATRTLTLDLDAPTATWALPATLTVGMPIAAVSPSGAPADVTGYGLQDGTLPPGLTLNPATGIIAGTPTTATTKKALVIIRLTDAGGNTGTGGLSFPAVNRGAQALSGFAYTPSSVRLDQNPPALTAPMVAPAPGGALSYSAAPADVCAVDPSTGTMTLGDTTGTCTVTATAAETPDRNEASATAVVTVTPRPELTGMTTIPVPENTRIGADVGSPLTPQHFPSGTSAWSITSGGAVPFAIDGGTGQLSLTGALDFEAGPSSYTLTVQLTRGDGTATAEVTVTVTDINDAAVNVTIDANIAGDDIVNIAEKADGFAVSGTTDAEAAVSVALGTGSDRPATVTGTVWTLAIPGDAAEITGTSLTITATAMIPGNTDRTSGTATRTLTVDLVPPTAAWTLPTSLTVDMPVAAVSPSSVSADVTGYALAPGGTLPPGLTLDPGTGVISGTPTRANAATAMVAIRLTDANGNTADADLQFPAVVKGTQTLSGFAYTPDSVRLGQDPPIVTPPTVSPPPGGALSYSAAPPNVCTVDPNTGALTLVAEGDCTVTATAAETANHNAGTATATVTVTPRPTLTGSTRIDVPENTPVGSNIGEPLTPVDFPPGTAVWRIADGANGAPVAINSGSGQLSIAAALDFETEPNTYDLTVELTRGGAVADMQVTVAEQNVEESPVAVTIAADIAGDDVINIAEKADGFAVSGTTENGAAVSVALGAGNVRAATVDGTAWTVQIPEDAPEISGTSLAVTAGATLPGTARATGSATRTLTVDLVPPAAAWTLPGSLTVDVPIAAVLPDGASGDVTGYALAPGAALPPGLTLDEDTGAVSGTPTTADTNPATVAIGLTDANDNTADVDIRFPAVAKGRQTLSGLAYTPDSVRLDQLAPTLTEPTVVPPPGGAVTYAAGPGAVCAVDADTGALTLEGTGTCTVTATAAETANHNAASATVAIAVTPAPVLTGTTTILVPENAPVDSDIGQPLTPQHFPPGDAAWSIAGGNDAGLFAIDSGTGQLSVAAALDFEDEPNSHVLTVRLARGDGMAEAQVTVTETDINEEAVAVTIAANIAGDDVINIAEKADGFAVSGTTEANATVSVTLGAGDARDATVTGTTWTVTIGPDAAEITGTGLTVIAAATLPSDPDRVAGTATRVLDVDLVAPTAAWTLPASLMVGVPVAAVAPAGASDDITGYALPQGNALPPGLTLDAATGVIAGTPTTASAAPAPATVRLTDMNGNPGDVALTFPAVAKGTQTLTGFAYDPASVRLDQNAPTLTPPTVAPPPGGAVTYAALPATVCMVDGTTGALTLEGTGTCTIMATAAETANHNAASATAAVAVTPEPVLTGTTTILVAETTPPGSDIGQPLTPQHFPPGDAAWSITAGNAEGLFAIDGGTGQLSVAMALDFDDEDSDSHVLTVRLVRGDGMAEAQVTVTETDVDETEVEVAIAANIAGDDVINIAEKAAGFVISGTTESGAAVRVTAGAGPARDAVVAGTVWTAAIPANAAEIAGTTLAVTATATISGTFRATGTASRTLNVDLVPPAAAWTTPATLRVDEPIAAIAPESASGDVVGYALQDGVLPPGLALDAATGIIAGTPTAANPGTATVIVRLTDMNGNTGDVAVLFPAVARGAQTLTGFAYTPASVRLDQPPPTLTPPTVAPAPGGAVTYAAAPATVCTVDAATGALALAGTGTCTVTATAAATANRNAATATAAVAVTPEPSLTGTTTILVPENTLPGSDIGQPLTPQNFPPGIAAWSIAAGNDGNVFAIDGGTGQLSLAQALDFEADPDSHVLTVRLERGDGTATAAVTVTVTDIDETEVDVAIAANIAGNDVINIAEKADGFAITGTTEAGAEVGVTLGAGEARPATVTGTVWTLAVAGDDSDITGTSITVSATATIADTDRAPGTDSRTLTVDLVAPVATWTAPETLTVGVTIAAISPSGASADIIGFALLQDAGPPPGLALDPATGAVSGTPAAANGNPATATVRLTDMNGNTADIDIAFPAVDRGTQTLTGFAYTPASVRRDQQPPTLTPPTGARPDSTLTYSAPASGPCAVNDATGALTLAGTGTCTVTATASETADYKTATATAMVEITAAPSLADMTINVPESTPVGSDIGRPPEARNFPPGIAAWSITAGNGDGRFAIDGGTGQLSLAQQLNFETPPTEFTLDVQLVRGDGMAEATVTITVIDVDESAVAVAIAANIADDDVVNIAEKAAGFAVAGTTENGAEVRVTLGSGSARPATVTGTSWTVAIPGDAAEVTGTSLTVTATATLPSDTNRAMGTAIRTLTVDLDPPTAAWTLPASLTVGVPIAAVAPAGASADVAGYGLRDSALPPGLTLNAGTGVISGTPAAATTTETEVTIRLTDRNGNTGDVDLGLPQVARGAQTLTGFAYDPASVRLDQQPPTLIPPTGARPDSALGYASSSAGVCTVNPTTGALTLVSAGTCTVTVTAAATADYDAATDTATVTVTPRPALTGTTTILVPETTPAGSDIGTPLTPQHFPSGIAAWTITAGNGAGIFAINGGTGQLSLAQELDFETPPNIYTLTVQLTRGDGTATAAVTVNVDDIDESEVDVTIAANIAGDDIINIAEKAAGFAVTGTTEAGAEVSVVLGAGSARDATVNGASWTVAIPANAPEITGTSLMVAATASIPDTARADGTARRTLTVDVDPPTASWTPPATLTVGEDIAGISPTGVSGDVTGYAVQGDALPPGLSLDAGSGAISGTPTAANADAATVTIRLTDANGNTADVDVTFPAVARGTQTLDGLAYIPASVRLDQDAPTLTPPTITPAGTGAALSYSAAPAAVCTVNTDSGALALVGVGTCTITATAARTDDYNEATDTTTVGITAAPSLTGTTTFLVPENTSSGSDIGTPLTPRDFPDGTPAWSITAGNDAGVFAIDANTGQLSLAPGQQLDFETPPTSYVLTVQLTRGDGTAAAVVTVNVDDIDETAVDVTIAANIAGNDVINISEKAAGFTITGTTEADAAVSVTLGSGSARDATVTGTDWTVAIPADAAEITGTSLTVTATATLPSAPDRVAGTAMRTLTADLVAPTAMYVLPATLQVGAEITGISPTGPSGDVTGYAVHTGTLPPGLGLDGTTGVISGIPTTATAATAEVTIRLTDANDNTGDVALTFPAVARGMLALTGFGYSPASVRVDQQAPTLTAPTITPAGTGAALSYSAAPAGVCTVDSATGALTLVSTGMCTITATAAQTANYGAATATAMVDITDAPSLTGMTTIDVPENRPVDSGIGTPLTPVNFPPGTANWSITAGNADGRFAIDAGTGQLSVAQALDFETQPTSYTLTVQLVRGDGTATTPVTITVTDVDESAVAVTIAAGIAGNDIVNIAEKATGFAITGTTESGATVSVALGSGSARPATVNGTSWTLDIPANDDDVAGTGITVTATATIPTAPDRAVGTATRMLTADLVAPTATYAAPPALRVGVAITAVMPGSPSADTAAYAVQSGTLPPGLTLDTADGAITGTPTTANADTAAVTIRLTDVNGNTGDVGATFPMVARGTQTLTGFAYSPASVRRDQQAPALTAPTIMPLNTGATLSYSAAPAGVCTVDSATGALTLVGTGTCTITATASQTADYNAATDMATVTITPEPALTGMADFQVPENTPAGDAIGTPLTPEHFPTGTANWEITAGNTLGLFAINALTGQLSLAQALDFETDPNVHTLTVRLMRGDGTATAQVTITETDINENAVNVTIDSGIAGDDVINIAEKAAGFAITGTTEAGATLTVALGARGRMTNATGTTWRVTIPGGDDEIAGSSVLLDVTARLVGRPTNGRTMRTLQVDLVAPTATYAAPATLTVGEPVAVMPGSPSADTAAYALQSGTLPQGLTLDTTTGAVSGTATAANAAAAPVTIRLTDDSGNPGDVQVTFPAVGRGPLTLDGFAYTPPVVRLDQAPPVLTAPTITPAGTGAVLSYASATADVCMVDAATGALTLVRDGACRITATASQTANYRAATATAMVTVDPPPVPRADFAATAEAADEGDPVTFTVRLAGTPAGEVRLDWAASAEAGDTAMAGGDFTAAEGTLTFTADARERTITIPTVDDLLAEGAETFTVTLSGPAPTGALELGTATATGTIRASDAATATVSGGSADEGQPVPFTVVLSGPPGTDLQLDWAALPAAGDTAAAADLDGDQSGSVTFAAGTADLSRTIMVATRDDELAEGDETFTLMASASPPVPGVTLTPDPLAAQGTIRASDGIVVSISPAVAEAVEGQPLTFTVALSGSPGTAVQVNYATAPGTGANAAVQADFTAVNGAIEFPAGATGTALSGTITVATVDDAVMEPGEPETFTVTLSPPAGGFPTGVVPGRSQATARIRDNDTTTVSVDDGAAPEGEEIPFAVRLSNPFHAELALDWVTSVEDGDTADADAFTPESGTVVVAAGATGATITVAPPDDEAAEGDRTFTLTVMAAAADGGTLPAGAGFPGGGAETTAQGLIEDDIAAITADRLGRVTLEILPHVARAMTDSTLSAIAGRLESAAAGTAPSPTASLAGTTHLLQALKSRERQLERGALELEQVLDGASFLLSPAAAEGDWTRAGEVAVWGSGDFRSLSGPDGGSLDWNGDMSGVHLGADIRLARALLAGVSVSRYSGTFDYADRGDAGAAGGTFSSRMTGVHPYVSWLPGDAGHLWATVGYGAGGIRIDDAESGRHASDTEMTAAAAGGSLRLLSDDSLIAGGTATLRLRGDGAVTRIAADGSGLIRPEEFGVQRLRVLLESSYECRPGAAAGCLSPSLEIGIRHDRGDARTGTGFDVGGGLRYTDRSAGLTVAGRGRALVLGGSGQEDWGVGGRIILDPGADGQGLSLSLAPSYGDAERPARHVHDPGGGDPAAGAGRQEGRLDTEIGYGFAGADGVLTPYTGASLAETGSRDYRLGGRLNVGSRFAMSLEGQRREESAAAPEHGVMLRGRMSW